MHKWIYFEVKKPHSTYAFKTSATSCHPLFRISAILIHLSFSQIISTPASQSLTLKQPSPQNSNLPNALPCLFIVNKSRQYLFTYNYALFTNFYWRVPMRTVVIFIKSTETVSHAKKRVLRRFDFSHLRKFFVYGHDIYKYSQLRIKIHFEIKIYLRIFLIKGH